MSAKRLLQNQRTAATAIDYGMAFIVGYFSNPLIVMLMFAYGLWVWHDSRQRLHLEQLIREEQSK